MYKKQDYPQRCFHGHGILAGSVSGAAWICDAHQLLYTALYCKAQQCCALQAAQQPPKPLCGFGRGRINGALCGAMRRPPSKTADCKSLFRFVIVRSIKVSPERGAVAGGNPLPLGFPGKFTKPIDNRPVFCYNKNRLSREAARNPL